MALSSHLLTSYLLKPSSFFNLFSKTPSLFSNCAKNGDFIRLIQRSYSPSAKPISKNTTFKFQHRLCTSTATASAQPTVPALSKKAQRVIHRGSDEGILQKKLGMCSRHGDLVEALRLYDDARSKKVSLATTHYNVLLYLCASSDALVHSNCSGEDGKSMLLGLRRGFEIFQQMGIDGIDPDEATFTSAARLAVKMEDLDMAFELLKKMISSNIPPKLRSYDPALLGFCKKGEADKAYEVDAHMLQSGITPEEPQLAALLQVSVNVERADKVYEMLHRLRASVRQVSESTFKIIEEWFKSRAAMEVGKEIWDVEKVKEGVMKGGGGWHGQGWLGKGEWKVVRTEMDEIGTCRCCGERLLSIDIDPLETDNFANLLSRLACQKEVRDNFIHFQNWLRRKGPFDAVIDGANVSLINSRIFDFFQLNDVVERVQELSPSKRLPLVILHSGRVAGGPANNPKNKKLLEKWRKAEALYTTPKGSNDDWYWLYAAVSSKCLLVTNDEMRDHLFQLLGTSFFPRWKEKHQVRLTRSRGGPSLHMPPPYSIVIQESESGSWHIPMVTNDTIDTPRQWLCAARASTSLHSTV